MKIRIREQINPITKNKIWYGQIVGKGNKEIFMPNTCSAISIKDCEKKIKESFSSFGEREKVIKEFEL